MLKHSVIIKSSGINNDNLINIYGIINSKNNGGNKPILKYTANLSP